MGQLYTSEPLNVEQVVTDNVEEVVADVQPFKGSQTRFRVTIRGARSN